MNEERNLNNNQGEITLRELILKVQEFWRELLRNWWLIALFCIPFLAYFLYQSYTTPAKYGAETKFIVEGQQSGGSLGGLLGSIGLGGSSKGVNSFKVREVARSKKLIANSLFSKGANGEYLANRIIEAYKMDEIWGKKNPDLLDFRFTKDSVPAFANLEKKALLSVISKTIGNEDMSNEPLMGITYNDESGIYRLKTNSTAPSITYDLHIELFDKLKYFFEEQMMEEKEETRDLLKSKTDSLQYLIRSKNSYLAKFEDQNRKLVSKQAQVQKSNLIAEISGLINAYGEALKSFEIADYTFKSSRPMFLKIDEPMLPLRPSRLSKVKSALKGIILGGLLGSLFVIFRLLYRKAMEEV